MGCIGVIVGQTGDFYGCGRKGEEWWVLWRWENEQRFMRNENEKSFPRKRGRLVRVQPEILNSTCDKGKILWYRLPPRTRSFGPTRIFLKLEKIDKWLIVLLFCGAWGLTSNNRIGGWIIRSKFQDVLSFFDVIYILPGTFYHLHSTRCIE